MLVLNGKLLQMLILVLLPTVALLLLLPQVPPTMRFVLDGEMPEYLLAKDLILQVRRGAASCCCFVGLFIELLASA
jgi:homoaconitase/3-isopropylmalate dehydratase large subunit